MPPPSRLHDERALRVGLEPDEAVHDVYARALERAGPADVALLVEARLQLDEHHGLLPLLGGADQHRHHRGVAGGSVDRVLDRKHVWIIHGLSDERLDGRVEALVRVVHEDVATAQDREDVGLEPLTCGLQRGRRDPGPFRPEQLGRSVGHELVQVGAVEQPVDGVHVPRRDPEVVDQLLAHLGRRRRVRARAARRRRSADAAARSPSPAGGRRTGRRSRDRRRA